ncbi:GbsR/MarR family transcriptional regulator [Oleiharenicola lentus]|uniref:GbsR/MarR family transcriptional regulator n=1 Tax=Oleiharenicola lentus TaxID=2508720 RepID=UPI003F67BA1E
MSRPSSLSSNDSAPQDLVLQGERNPEIVGFEAEMVQFFVSAAELLSVPKSVAAIYGLIVASPAPLSFADIEARLNFSKGSVSQGLRALREVGAVKEVSTAADRTELFMPDMEMRSLIDRFIEQRLKKQLDTGKNRLATLNRATAAFSATEQKVVLSRVQKLQQWNDRTRALLPVVRTFLSLTKL